MVGELGWSFERYWDATPAEVIETLAAVGEVRRREQRSRVEQAWLTAVLSRAAKVPPLAELLGDAVERPKPEAVPVEGTPEYEARVARMRELAAKGPPITGV